ncbi:RNA-guided endonuclease TnpB family protein [Actinomadura sp. K4S16]|uniref:RNA-guided endonuclease InsQ/TnpB family protein n=1 Tax=Actinomadura sp. K4S16 TaxID=1316147 RepID=UPI0011EBAA86|nr:RNA-guided endonuclease TnpB family protein [Actinomadura sp. K4S16]
MYRYRLCPTSLQEAGLLEHCGHARFVWNLAVEQQSWWTPRRGPAPGYLAQARQLTEARAANPWLAAGSQTVQQQALRDFAQAMSNFFAGTHRRPTWRKAGLHEGFRIVGVRRRQWDVRRLSRRTGEVRVPKVGWVRFRWSRPVPEGVKSFRVTRDRAGRWHVAFAAVPDPVPAPGNGQAVGVDRGVAVSAALSTGETSTVAGLTPGEAERLNRLLRCLARAKRGSNRRNRIKAAMARLKAREADRRKDWVEKTSTDLARRFEVIAVEDLDVRAMTRSAKGTIGAPGAGVRHKAGLNRGILANGWGQLAARLEHKAPGRVIRVNPAYTSQTCNPCGHRAPENRESQAVFRCVACGHQAHADVNAARNIRDTAVGRTVAARGALQPEGGAVNREPQSLLLPA